MIELVFVNHNPMGSCRLNTSRHGHVWSASSAYSAQFVQESSCALVVVVVEQPEANQGDVRSMTKYVPLHYTKKYERLEKCCASTVSDIPRTAAYQLASTWLTLRSYSILSHRVSFQKQFKRLDTKAISASVRHVSTVVPLHRESWQAETRSKHLHRLISLWLACCGAMVLLVVSPWFTMFRRIKLTLCSHPSRLADSNSMRILRAWSRCVAQAW